MDKLLKVGEKLEFVPLLIIKKLKYVCFTIQNVIGKLS